MHQLLYVAAGGAIGAALRFWVSSWINRHSLTNVPEGTLFVNLLGSLAIGWLWGIFMAQSEVPLRLQLFLVTGLLGGFTTFSSFSLENWQLIEQGHWRSFIVYVLLSNIGGLALAFAGFKLSGTTING
jgi:CrcB protein